MLEIVFLLAGMAVGYTLKKEPAPIVRDPELQDQLAIAQNLNVSLRRDLDEAKEALWKLKQEKQNGNKKTS